MSDAYRDDLAAAQLRVEDLEREHAALQAHNAKLEALVAAKPVAPVPRRRRRRDTPAETAALVIAIIGAVGIFLLAGGPAAYVDGVMIGAAAVTRGVIVGRRWLTGLGHEGS